GGQGEGGLADLRAVELGVVDGADVHVAAAVLAVVGEVEAALAVQDDVVRAVDPVVGTLGVEVADLPADQIDDLDGAGGAVGGRQPGGHRDAVVLHPLEAAVVGDVELAAGSQGRPVGPAAGLRDALDRAAGRIDARDRAALDLDDENASVVEDGRTFGELEALGDNPHVQLLCRRPSVWPAAGGRADPRCS